MSQGVTTFRSDLGAASLKLVQRLHRATERRAFRSDLGAASLKPVMNLISGRVILGLPLRSRSGLIEARG